MEVNRNVSPAALGRATTTQRTSDLENAIKMLEGAFLPGHVYLTSGEARSLLQACKGSGDADALLTAAEAAGDAIESAAHAASKSGKAVLVSAYEQLRAAIDRARRKA